MGYACRPLGLTGSCYDLDLGRHKRDGYVHSTVPDQLWAVLGLLLVVHIHNLGLEHHLVGHDIQ